LHRALRLAITKQGQIAWSELAHLVSWATFAPIDRQSAGTRKGGSTGKGNLWLAATLGEVVVGLARTNTFLGDRYRRPGPPPRQEESPGRRRELGPEHPLAPAHRPRDPLPRPRRRLLPVQINTRRRQRDLIRQLEHLTGQTVTLRATA